VLSFLDATLPQQLLFLSKFIFPFVNRLPPTELCFALQSKLPSPLVGCWSSLMQHCCNCFLVVVIAACLLFIGSHFIFLVDTMLLTKLCFAMEPSFLVLLAILVLFFDSMPPTQLPCCCHYSQLSCLSVCFTLLSTQC